MRTDWWFPPALENGNGLTFSFKGGKIGWEVNKALETDTLPRSPIAVWCFTAETLQTPRKVEKKHNVNYWRALAVSWSSWGSLSIKHELDTSELWQVVGKRKGKECTVPLVRMETFVQIETNKRCVWSARLLPLRNRKRTWKCKAQHGNGLNLIGSP